jgi:EAL domain-containing protein (putative c-di-GMP-specific phosphodiesterase class I)
MLSEPFIIESHEIFITASIGIAMYPFDGQNIDTLLMNADISMYQAKRSGRNTYQFYSKAMNSFTLERFTMENKLWKALEQDEFRLFYQPQVDLSTGDIIGVEALIRWLQPDLLFVKPKDFLPLAEETGLIVKIGEWVLRNACSQSRFWQTMGIKPIMITANVSSAQFKQENFVDTVDRIISDTGMDPVYLQLELTESTLMQDSEDTIKKLSAFRDMGIKISIDDFGTGYSSLNYLKRFPISTLKIDQSFIRDINSNQDDQSITRAIIGLARNLNLNVIAEGVEKRRQMVFLRQHGCNAIQGYFICPPLNNDSLIQFINEKRYLKMIDPYHQT